MDRNIVNFDVDRPRVIRLDKGPEGKETRTKSGSAQWMYALNQNRDVMWLPQAGRDALMRSGAQPGDEIEVLKTVRGGTACFTAKVVKAANHSPQPVHTNGHPPKLPARAFYQPDCAPEQRHRNGHTSESDPEAEVNSTRPAFRNQQEADEWGDAEEARYANPARTVNGLAHQEEPNANPEPPISVTSQHYMSCLCAAIDAVSEAQEYGRKRGLGLTFLGGDIRAIATTFYINDQNRQEVR